VRRRLVAALVGVCATAAGALAAPAGARPQPAAQPDACTLVPEAELEAAAGYPLEPGEPVVSTSEASGCGFQATTPSDGPDVGILVSTTVTGRARKTFSVKTLERGFGKSTELSDLGSRADYAFKKGKVPQAALYVVDGTDGVAVTLRGATTRREARTEATAIAALVLDALGGTATGTTSTTQAGG
jgi:hypothetical protein